MYSHFTFQQFFKHSTYREEKTFFIPGEDLHVHKNYVRQNYHTPSDD